MNKILIQTPYRQKLHQRILKEAMREFYSRGIKAVKMDDIAQNLAISKRTLYEIYRNKEELLLEGIKNAEDEFDLNMAEFIKTYGNNVMDIMIEFYHMQLKFMSEVSPLFFEELNKYDQVLYYLETKHRERDAKAAEFFKRGIQEGFFRADANYEIVTEIGRVAIEHSFKSQMYKKYSLQTITQNIVLLIIRGICTQQGLDMIDRTIFIKPSDRKDFEEI